MRILTIFGITCVIACRTDKSITIQNPAPKADIVSHDDGNVVLEGIPIVFVGSVTDANHTPDQLVTIWYVNDDIVCDEVIPNENGETSCELALGLEDTQITLAVRDPENARNDNTIVVAIEPTQAPQADILTPIASGVYYSDQKITFEGTISDAEDVPETLIAYWESDIDGVLSNVDTEPDSTGTVVGYEYLTEGEHAIELHVEDSTGKTDRETVIVDVGPPNSAPLCEILTPLDGSAGTEGIAVTFTGTTSDVDVSPSWLTVSWASDKDGALGTSTPNSDGTIGFAYSNLTVDTHAITLTVTDEVGAICTDSIFYTVGTPPSITIDSPLDGSVFNEGEPISFSATVSDAQEQPDAVSLNWAANGSSISAQNATSSGTASFSDATLPFGTYNLVVTATDTDGLTDSDQVNFTINGVPSTPLVSINPNTPTTSDGLNVSIDTPSVDPEGMSPTYTYEWQLGGQVQTAYTASSLPSSATTKGEQWTVVVTPNDGTADGIPGTATATIGNTAPAVTSVSVTPSIGLYNDAFVTCLGAATDPDETPSLSYEWSIDGATVGTSDTLLLLLTDATPFDTLVCTVTADDGTDVDTASASVLIENRDPIIVASIVTNGTNHNAELTCEVSLQELDGDTTTVSYEWFNGGIALGTANPIQLDSTMASAGDVIFCIPTATDGNGGIGVSNATHMITNTVPVINSVTVTPDPATVGLDDLTCAVSASDADGDSLLYSYQWSDSTGVQQTTTLVSDTTDVFLTGGLTEDTWTCEVTPYDGTDYGVAGTGTATAQNNCPVEGDGSRQNCPSLDCATILNDGHSTGDGFYWIDPEQISSAYEVYCLMDSAYDGGGWTLISVHSDDGQDTWTWNNRGYFDTDTTTFGSLSALNEDFKSPALHDVYMHDLLFVHAPSGIWAGYNDVDSGLGDFGSFVGQIGGPICYSNGEGFLMTSGTLSVTGNLCSTELFINLEDRDGGSCGSGNGSHSYGPAWSAHQNSGCFDDPGAVSGLGPFVSNPSTENEPGPYTSFSNQPRGYGFGWSILANTGVSGAAENYMQVFVRRNYIDADGDGFYSWEDCDDNDVSISPAAIEACDGIDNNCDGQVDETCSYYWNNVGQQSQGVIVGCCNNSASHSATCDASVLGAEIHIANDGNSIERKNLYDNSGWGRYAAQGYSISLINNSETATWTGGVNCGCDRLEVRTVSVYECSVQ